MKITLPPEKRQAAVDCFQKGLGYKRTAEAIGVSASTVRDWKRLWNAGKFSVNPMVSSLGPLTPSEKEIIRDKRIKGDRTERSHGHSDDRPLPSPISCILRNFCRFWLMPPQTFKKTGFVSPGFRLFATHSA